MTKREARRRAHRAAGGHLQGLIDSGWPWEMQDLGVPPESERGCEKMREAMQELVERLMK